MDPATSANIIAALHFAIVAAVIIGLLISFRYKRFRPWEAGIILVIVVLWSYYGNCPLTILEQYFREMAGQYSNMAAVGFLPHYANKLLNIELTSRIVQRFTFFTGGALFVASIEWVSPYLHFHVFSVRKNIRRFFRSLKKSFA